MHGATVHHHPGMMRPTHLRAGRLLLLLCIPLLLLAAGVAFLRWANQGPGSSEAQDTTGWMPTTQRASYTPEAVPTPPAAPPVDPWADRWAMLQRQLAQMQADINAVKNRPQPTPTPPPAAPKAAAVPKKHAPMLFISHDLPEKKALDVATYTLAPGATKIACQVETVMNSDAGETFTAKTTTPVYDTATGRYLLIPQNSTILGRYDGAGLLYGNERLPTLSLFLTLPSGETVELGHSPVTNQAGTSGLVSEVDNHYWRLFGAVFIGGALRGGAMALQSAAMGGGDAGAIATGIAQSGSQVVQRQMGRALDTRPTIHVHAGELCNVILLKPLELTAAGP